MDMLITVVVLVIGITLHEVAHALMGDYLGDPTARNEGRISLNPMAHIDPFTTLLLPLMLILFHSPVVFAAAKPVPFNPWAVRGGKWGAVLVAMAGPFTNLLLAMFCAMWLRIMPYNAMAWRFLGPMILINISLFVFNMIPFPPLDGSRLLYALVPIQVREVMDRIEQGGLMILFVVMFVAFPVISPYLGIVTSAIASWLLPSIPTLP